MEAREAEVVEEVTTPYAMPPHHPGSMRTARRWIWQACRGKVATHTSTHITGWSAAGPQPQAQRSPRRASGRVPGAQQGLLGTSYRTLRASVEVLQTGIFAATALTVANIAVIADPFNFLNPLDHLVAVHGICTQAQGTTVNIR